MSDSYSELLKHPFWQKKRLEIFSRDSFVCQHCMASDKTLSVHHIKYYGKPWECPDKYLITLCVDCHDKEESLKDFDWYKSIADSGLTRKDFGMLIEHVNYYLSFVDPRDINSFLDVLKKIVPDENIREFHASKFKN